MILRTDILNSRTKPKAKGLISSVHNIVYCIFQESQHLKVAGTVFSIYILGLNSNIDMIDFLLKDYSNFLVYKPAYVLHFFKSPIWPYFKSRISISGHPLIGVFRAISCQKMI